MNDEEKRRRTVTVTITTVVAVIVVGLIGWYLYTRYQERRLEDKSAELQQVLSGQDLYNLSEQSLDLSGRGLTTVPPSVFDFRDLVKILSLRNNLLTGALPSQIERLVNLEVLDVSMNRMTGIPVEIGKLSKLRVLDYSDNEIDTMPQEIANLAGLKELSLAGNNYRQMPTDLLKINSLEVLDLSGNQISDIPSEITNLTNLKQLILTDNLISMQRLFQIRNMLPNVQVVF